MAKIYAWVLEGFKSRVIYEGVTVFPQACVDNIKPFVLIFEPLFAHCQFLYRYETLYIEINKIGRAHV